MFVFNGELQRALAHFVRDIRRYFAVEQQTVHEHVVTVRAGEEEQIGDVLEGLVVVRPAGRGEDRRCSCRVRGMLLHHGAAFKWT